MFSVIGLRKVANVSIVQTEDEFWKRFKHYTPAFDTSTKELETQHSEVDLRLVDGIDRTLEPVIGPSGIDSEPWHQNLDFYGDGVRSLEVVASRFPPTVIAPLHSLLTGEHETFSILIKYYTNFTDEPLQRSGLLAIFHPRILMTQSLVSVFEHA